MRAKITEYLLLARVLFFPARWFERLVKISFGISVLGLLASKIFAVGMVVALIPTTLFLLLNFFIAVFMQGQMLALASSKQFFLLGSLRERMLCLAFVQLIICSAILAIAFVRLGNQAVFLPFFASIFCTVSIVFALLVIVCRYWAGMQGLVFIGLAYYIKLGSWFLQSGTVFSTIGIFITWSLFAAWFIKWKPNRFHLNVFSVSQSDFARNQELTRFSLYGFTNRLYGKPQSLIGSMLLGASDGWLVQIKRLLAEIAIFIFFISFPYFINAGSSFGQALANNASVYLAISMSSQVLKIYLVIAANFSKVWLFHSGSRDHILLTVEKCFYPRVIVSLIPGAVVFIVASVTLIDKPLNLLALFGIMPSIVLLGGASLYMAIYLTLKRHGVISWGGWVSTLIGIALMASSVMIQYFVKPTLASLVGLGIYYAILGAMAFWQREKLLRFLSVASLSRVKNKCLS